jgi:prepilin-type N-terminal cleavage/methylation domain-containing protein/prepilin-type processing-associated H-X9-DG protein
MRRSRRGFTLFELLVVLALLALLLGLLLPAIQKVRQASARFQCVNNEKQILLAMHNYHSASERFPPAVGSVGNQNVHGTALFFLLPYIEQDNLYKRALNADGTGSPWNDGVYSTPVVIYSCPADATGSPDHRFGGWLASGGYGLNWLVLGDQGGKIADITDGTSNTLLIAERYQVCNGTPCGWAYDSLGDPAPVFAYASQAKFQVLPAPMQCDPSVPNSPHVGGINAGMADGSVRFMNQAVSPRTWYYLSTPSGGEVPDNDF